MDSELKNDFSFNEKELFQEKKTVSGKVTPKDVILNALSAVLCLVVVVLCNLFISGEFHYQQIFNWNFGITVIVNWVCGIIVTYSLRQSGINTAKMTKNYILAEQEKDEAFNKITDFNVAQKRLNQKIQEEFELTRNELESVIAKLVKPYTDSEADWKIGQPLPKKTHLNVRRLKYKLEHMTPPILSLNALAQSEASYNTRGLYDVPSAPDSTNTAWFVKKGAGKIGWFAIAPIVLSILANGLVIGISLGNIVSVIGIITVMLFNAARSYTIAYQAVSTKGVARFKQIVKIINSITD